MRAHSPLFPQEAAPRAGGKGKVAGRGNLWGWLLPFALETFARSC